METICSCERVFQVFWLVSYGEAVRELQKSRETTLGRMRASNKMCGELFLLC